MLVSGTLTLDTIERDGTTWTGVPGGSALYAAAAASLLLPVTVVGTVGGDFPFAALQPIWDRGVDRSGIEVLDGPTFRWHARYNPDGETRVTVARDAGVSADRLPRVLHVNKAVVLLGSTNPDVQAHVLHACPGASVVGLDSMSHWWTERADALRALLPRVHVLFVDEAELALATGTADVAAGVEQLHALGVEVVAVKRGSRGAMMSRRMHAPVETRAVPLGHAVDPTGAGDAFAGAFMAALASQPAWSDAAVLHFATAVASYAVEGVGVSGLLRADLAAVELRVRALGSG